jgi:Ca2+-binding EF-hand superfamily protein
MRLVPAAFVLVTVHFMLCSTAWAQGPTKPYDPRAAFAEVDTNEDGQIDIEEFHVRLVEVFYRADSNKDGFLSVDEYGRLPFSGAFKAADANGDGRISLPEFVRIRFRQFEEADTNHDYQLSADEVVTAYEGEQKQ